MYSFTYDKETGGILLNTASFTPTNETRPVYYRELDILGFDRYFTYEKNDDAPYMWAENQNYYYRGKPIAKTQGGSLYTPPELVILDDEPEPGHAPLQPVDIPAMVEKNRPIIEKISADTIKKIYNVYTKYQNKIDVFYVAFSGGKDSVVVLDLVQRALPHNQFKVLFGDTNMEFPDTYKVVEQIEKQCKALNIDFLRSECEFSPVDTWCKFGPPSQRIRWCCSVHKTTPQILLLRKYLNNPSFSGMAFTGIRGEESSSRSQYKTVSKGEKIAGQWSCHPILDWSSAELYIYIYTRKLILNDAYKKGNSRAGCLVCPLATKKNMFFKEQSYSTSTNGQPSTTTFNNIILNTTSKTFTSQAAVKEFMDIAGWKARRSGTELSISKNNINDSFENDVYKAHLTQLNTDWKQWLKTVGNVSFLENGNVKVEHNENTYLLNIKEDNGELNISTSADSSTRAGIKFISELKIILKKTAYCIGCRACEANCPNGYISMKNGKVIIDDRCVKCKKCQDITYGCLVANSLRLPKGEKKMGTIDRYSNLGVRFEWVYKYFKLKDEFWTSPYDLGSNMVKSLKRFLNDSEITENLKFTRFGHVIASIGLDTADAWALILCNLVYTSQFNWWVKNIDFSTQYTPDLIYAMLDETMSKNSKSHVISGYKNILVSNPHLGVEVGLGECDYTIKNNACTWNSVTRKPWENPNPLVILYSLYKFAQACNGYYQFSLTRLLNHETESDGVSPTEIFGIDRETMQRMVTGLSANYSDYINGSFTLGLDHITLNSEKTSQDILELF